MSEINEHKQQKIKLKKIHPDTLLALFRQVPGDYGKLLLHYFNNIYQEDYEDNIYTLITNPNVPFPIVLELFNSLNLIPTSKRYNIISQNNVITIPDILKHPEIKWDYHSLSHNPNMTWEFIQETMETKHYQGLKKGKWNFVYLSYNPCITFDIIKKYPQYEWDYVFVSENPNITLKIVKENPDLPWNIEQLTKNPNIKLRDILENKNIFKDRDKYIRSYIHNPNLNIKDVLDYQKLYKDSNWESISDNPGIGINDILKTEFLPWDLEMIQYNPNLTFKTIIENIDKNRGSFKLDYLLDNKYGFNKYAKQRKDIIFPKYWLMVFYLYRYIYDETKPKDKVYKIADIIINKTVEMMTDVIIKQTIPEEVIKYNDKYENTAINSVGFLTYTINNIIKAGYKLNIEWELDTPSMDNFAIAYINGGGIKIYNVPINLDKKQCGDDNEYFTQENFDTFEVKDLVSFELEGKVFCLSREALIGFWDQTTDETGSSGAYNWGDCKYDRYDNPYENTCKRFYKIPIPATYISQKTKNLIKNDTEINYWKLKLHKNVRMGRGLHYIGEYSNPNEPIYVAMPASQYGKRED